MIISLCSQSCRSATHDPVPQLLPSSRGGRPGSEEPGTIPPHNGEGQEQRPPGRPSTKGQKARRKERRKERTRARIRAFKKERPRRRARAKHPRGSERTPQRKPTSGGYELAARQREEQGFQNDGGQEPNPSGRKCEPSKGLSKGQPRERRKEKRGQGKRRARGRSRRWKGHESRQPLQRPDRG